MSALAIRAERDLEQPLPARAASGPTAGLGWDWLSELRDERTWMRRRAAAALSKMPHCARRVVDGLRELLDDRDPQTRRWARLALENAGAGTRAAEASAA